MPLLGHFYWFYSLVPPSSFFTFHLYKIFETLLSKFCTSVEWSRILTSVLHYSRNSLEKKNHKPLETFSSKLTIFYLPLIVLCIVSLLLRRIFILYYYTISHPLSHRRHLPLNIILSLHYLFLIFLNPSSVNNPSQSFPSSMRLNHHLSRLSCLIEVVYSSVSLDFFSSPKNRRPYLETVLELQTILSPFLHSSCLRLSSPPPRTVFFSPIGTWPYSITERSSLFTDLVRSEL